MSMKINNIKHGQIEGLNNKDNIQRNEHPEKRGGRTKEADRSASRLSRLGNLIYKARVEASRNDNVRNEKVEQARQRIEEGYYNSPGVRSKLVSRLAEKVIASMRE